MLDGESQIDLLSFGVNYLMGFNIPIANNKGCLYVQRTLGCISKEDLNCSLIGDLYFSL